MRIGVDCHVFSGKYQGTRTYILNLYKALLKLDKENEYFFFGHWDKERPFGQNARYISLFSASRLKRLLYESSINIIKYKIDIYHTNYISPLVLPCKSLVTIHDILFKTHRIFFTRRESIRNMILVRLSAKMAWQIHTVSEYTKQSLLENYALSDAMIRVIPNGVDTNIFSRHNIDLSKDLIRNKFGIHEYILTVGRLEPRKNHITLLRAYSKLRARKPDIGPLVIVGQKDFGYENIFRSLRSQDISNHVIFLEHINDELLPSIYRAASLFVYPSFAEGFGIPPLEAMSCGVPVISSNTTAIPEVVKEAGILVNPYDTEAICEAMNAIISDPRLRHKLALDGRKQAERMSWRHSAEMYLSAVNEACG